MYQKKAPWQINSIADIGAIMFCPRILPDNVARAQVFDATTDLSETPSGGKDMFGIDWEYIPVAGGSMIRPGQPCVEDANDLDSTITWPDIDSWDWEGSRKINEAYLESLKGKCINTWIPTGYFERLISIMDFENAALALADEDQEDAVHAFMEKLSDLYVKLMDKFVEFFPEIEVYYIHDDWGAQKSSFFSPAVAADMLVPYMKKVNDRLHSHGKYVHCHSCGHLENQVENIIAAGYDAWDPQPVNDTIKLYEKYGDQIIIGVVSDLEPQNTTEEEQRAYAREFAAKCCKPGKPSMLSMYASPMLEQMLGMKPPITSAFMEELYIQSRKNYVNNQ